MTHQRTKCFLLLVVATLFCGIEVVQGQMCQGTRTNDVTRDTDSGEPHATRTWDWDDSTLGARIRNPDQTEVQLDPVASTATFSYDFLIGESVVYAIDGANVVCQFTVTVVDNEDPVIVNCPSTLTFSETEKVTWTPIEATDNSGQPILTRTAGLSADIFYPGDTTNEFVAEDPSGNTATCTFSVMITDTTAPQIDGCPPPEAELDSNNNPTYVVRGMASLGSSIHRVLWTEPTANPANGITVSRTRSPGSEFIIGSTLVRYTFTDQAGVASYCDFHVIVDVFEDTEQPQITCPDSLTVLGALNQDRTAVSWIVTMEPTDNVGVVQANFYPNNGSMFGIGTSEVVHVVEDAAGNQAQCSFSITVIANTDNDDPVIVSCPQSFTHYTSGDQDTASVTWSSPTVHDGNQYTLESTFEPPHVFAVGGSYDVVYTATDAAGNTAMCAFSIDVIADTQPPEVSCPGNIDLYVKEADANVPVSVSWDDPTVLATDNSGNVNVRKSHRSPTLFTPGIRHTVTYTAVDGFNLQQECTFEVHIQVDPAPVFGECNSVVARTDDNAEFATVIWVDPTTTVTDENPEMSGSPIRFNMPDYSPPHEFPIGTTNILYTATDSRGSVTQCTVAITVVDNQNPILIGCPTGVLEFEVFNRTFQSAEVTWTEPIVMDNSDDFVVTTTLSPGSLRPVGEYIVQYTARDTAGNQQSCTFTVRVNNLPGDDTNPVFSGCPSNIDTRTDPGVDYVDVTWEEPNASDDLDTSLEVTSSHRPGHRFYIGMSEVTYTATDDAGNRVDCTFSVTVRDEESPVFTSCSANVYYFHTAHQDSVLAKLSSVTAMDNSGSVQLDTSSRRVEAASSPARIDVVARDGSDNIETCPVLVTLEETIDVLIYPGQVLVNRFRDSLSVPADLSLIESDLNDHFRCTALAGDFAGLNILTSVGPLLSYEVSFYTGTIENPYSERGRYTSQTIEDAFVNALYGDPPLLFDTGNEVPSRDSFQINVCEFRGTMTLVSSSEDGSAISVADLTGDTQDPTTVSSLRQRIHLQLDRTFRPDSTYITSVIYSPFLVSTTPAGVFVDFVLIYEDTSTTVTNPPSEAAIQRTFTDQLRFESTTGYTELGSSDLFMDKSSDFEIVKPCSDNYCNGAGTCTIGDRLVSICMCQFNYSGTRCEVPPAATPTTSAATPTTSANGLTTGQLIGIIAGAIGVLLLLMLLLCCCCIFFMASQPKGPPLAAVPVPYEEPVPYMPPRAIAYAEPEYHPAIAYPSPAYPSPAYVHEEMYVPEHMHTSVVGYGGGPIIEEVDSYPAYKRDYLDGQYFI